jgi:methylthioribulose-1-phosphate dehydratase
MRIPFTIFALALPFLNLFAISFDQAAEEIVEAGVFLNRFGLCPATSGNLSRRLEEQCVVVTASGKHKGELTTEDVLIVDLDGKAQGGTKKPSAETLLHTAIYALFKDVGAVLHTHSLNGIVLTRIMPSEKLVVTEGYEIHKVFPGIRTHDSRLEIPIFENSQDIAAMAAEVTAYLQEHPQVHGFLIRGHGFYTWGRDMQEAKIRIEAFEHLFETELKIFAATKGD